MSKAKDRRKPGFCPDEDRSKSSPRDSATALRVPVSLRVHPPNHEKSRSKQALAALAFSRRKDFPP